MTGGAPPERVVGVGVDLVDVARLRTALGRTPRLAHRLFTPSERDAASHRADPVADLAARFAAKEAVMKALGRGIDAVSFTDVEVSSSTDGTLTVTLGGRALDRATEVGVTGWQVSTSEVSSLAQAVVVALG